jgi:molybdate transport system permease protein
VGSSPPDHKPAGRSSPRPAGLVVLAAGALALVALPVAGLAGRAPWASLASRLAQPAVLTALRLSLVCSLGAVCLSAVLGVPLAWVLARVSFPGRSLVRAVAVLPMVLPPVVGGVALLSALGRRGIPGRWLAAAGVTLPFTTAGAVLAQTFVALPFLVVAAEAGFRSVDGRFEEAAASLGAGPWRTFSRVTLPMAAPSLRAGLALCWARALGEFGATVTFAGNLPGRTQTLPTAVYLALGRSLEAAVAMSLVLIAVSLIVLVGLRARWLPTRP